MQKKNRGLRSHKKQKLFQVVYTAGKISAFLGINIIGII